MPSAATYDLLEACRQAGCPVCRWEARMIERYIDNLFYESVNDIKTREHLRAGLGFCREHTHLALDRRLGSALGFAIIYHDVLNAVLRGLEQGTPQPGPRRAPALLKQMPEQLGAYVLRILHALTPHKHCVVCQHQERIIPVTLTALLKDLANPQVNEALRFSDGLCIPHLKKAFEAVPDAATCDTLLSIHRDKLESLRGELAEFIRKNDYRFNHEGFGAEGDSWRRAVERLTGSRFGTQE